MRVVNLVYSQRSALVLWGLFRTHQVVLVGRRGQVLTLLGLSSHRQVVLRVVASNSLRAHVIVGKILGQVERLLFMGKLIGISILGVSTLALA